MRSIIKKIVSPFLKKASEIYLSKPRRFTYKKLSVMVEPTVFPPFITISTKLLLDFCETLQLKGKTFLELGCGCGIISILAASKGAKVTATDVNIIALDALDRSAVENRVSIRTFYSDLFRKLKGESFDVILINPPYYPKRPKDITESAWYCGEDFQYFEKLFAQLPKFAAGANEVYMILSEDCELGKIKSIALRNGITFKLVSEKKVVAEKNYIFRLTSISESANLTN